MKLKFKIDIETFSDENLNETGVFKYAESPQFQILLFAYKYIDHPVEIIDMVKNPILPQWIIDILLDPNIIKVAHNAMFEITCISAYLMNMCIIDEPLDPSQWECSAAIATSRGFPLSLEAIAHVMRLSTQKDKRGYALIRLFCIPRKDGGRNMPKDFPTEWEEFKQYCKTDVIVEDEICQKLGKYNLTEDEKLIWNLDQKINAYGVRIDEQFAINNVKFNILFKQELEEEAVRISGLAKPNSVKELKKFIAYEQDFDGDFLESDSLDKKAIEKLLKKDFVKDNKIIERLLQIRQMSGKTSVKKYTTMLNSVCQDGRIKGMFQYYGANRTGRFSGRGVQLHNLATNKMKDLQDARDVFAEADYDWAKVMWPNIADTSSQLIRPTFIPSKGNVFIISDFSAIEARVVAWLANEKWRLDIFNDHGKIYEASAAQMFKVPIESVTEGSDLRTRGKIAELALGYGGSEGAIQRMDIKEQLPDKKERLEIVYAWRAANPNICGLWDALNAAAFSAIHGSPIRVSGMVFTMDRGSLRIILPSGRSLYYLGARIGEGKFGSCVKYHGLDQKTKKWFPMDTYGGKLLENCLGLQTKVLTDSGWKEIQSVQITDLVHDGINFVSHEGLVMKNTQDTIQVNRIYMTPDHKILTNDGWKNASSCQGHFSNAVRIFNSSDLSRIRRKKISLESSMHLRENFRNASRRIFTSKTKILWVQEKRVNRISKYNIWIKLSPTQIRMERNDRKMRKTKSSSIQKLRCKRNKSLQALAQFSFISKRCLSYLEKRTQHGKNKQLWKLQTEELQMGNPENSSEQYKENKTYNNNIWNPFDIRNSKTSKHAQYDAALQDSSWMGSKALVCKTGYSQQVCDIKNAGPLNRFVILGDTGPIIVHNCTQAIARDCLAYAMLRLDDAGFKICMHVHDEVVLDVNAKDAPHKLDIVRKIMRTPAWWASGTKTMPVVLPLGEKTFISNFYKKD